MAKKEIKERFSMKGWEPGKFIFGQWKTVKEILKLAVPMIVTGYYTNDPAVIALLTILGKAVLDMGDYWVKYKKL